MPLEALQTVRAFAAADLQRDLAQLERNVEQWTREAADRVVERFDVSAVVSATYTAAVGELVRYDTSGGAFVILLPSPSQVLAGRTIAYRNVGGSATNVTFDAPTGNVDGTDTLATAGSGLLVCDGEAWWSL